MKRHNQFARTAGQQILRLGTLTQILRQVHQLRVINTRTVVLHPNHLLNQSPLGNIVKLNIVGSEPHVVNMIREHTLVHPLLAHHFAHRLHHIRSTTLLIRIDVDRLLKMAQQIGLVSQLNLSCAVGINRHLAPFSLQLSAGRSHVSNRNRFRCLIAHHHTDRSF